jgi:hypothetical protein
LNKLYLGDNLDLVQERIKDESGGVVYLDPPFNSNANCNVPFETSGGPSELLLPFARDKVAPAKGDFVDPSIRGARLALTGVGVDL